MADTLSQAKEMFKSIDAENTGLVPRADLKMLMQEIGGDLWAGDNFDTMLETCGVAPGSGEVKYGDFLEQLLGGEGEQQPDAPKAEKSAAPAAGEPDAKDIAEALAIVAGVCKKVTAAMDEGPPSLFSRLGGEPAVEAAVEKFYGKIVEDDLLKPIFAAVAMDGLKAMQKKFLTVAFGGPNKYDGKSLKEAHQGKGITDAHFGAVAGHLAATLTELGVPEKEHGEAMTIAASVKGDIVEAGGAGEAPAAAA